MVLVLISFSAGVPQIVLAVWFDTYDFAARVEFLGIGVCGNHKTAPTVNSSDFGRALIRVLASRESERMKQNARGIASALGPVEGRVVACERVLGVMEDLIMARYKM